MQIDSDREISQLEMGMKRNRDYYRGKRVLVTGGAAGIGALIAERVSALGATTVVWDLNEAALEAASAQARRHATYVCDVADRHAVRATAERVLREHGPIDILINNAGVVTGKLLLELSEEDIERTLQVNTLALFWTTRAFLPAMIRQGTGHIVTVASAAGLVATVRQTDYAASKYAAVGFDEALRSELHYLGHKGILTTVVCPYYISTGMFEGVKTGSRLLPIIAPEAACDQIVEAISDRKPRLVVPRIVLASYLGKLIGTRFFDAATRWLGVPHGMDAFKGHDTDHTM